MNDPTGAADLAANARADRRSARCCIVGGGPAGMMLGLLLARADIQVLVLEKHGDFLRDFRGDTVHPSTLDVMADLGLLDAFLARPHDEVRRLHANISGREFAVADFSRLHRRCNFIALMPQWDFLDFLKDEAERHRGFELLMNCEAIGLIEHGGRVTGVKAESAGGRLQIDADLVVACDGRGSVLRHAAGLVVRDLAVPIDVLWFRVAKAPGDDNRTGAFISNGRMMVLIDRGGYWQCAYVIAKGGIDALRARGIDAFRADVAAAAPPLAAQVEALEGWDEVKLLSVKVDRLEQWCKPGLLCIGDAAHAMSPVGGVGINLAVQDAVAVANLLRATLADPAIPADATAPLLAQVQSRRGLPTRVTQWVQVAIQNRLIASVLQSAHRATPIAAPWPIRLLQRFPALQVLPAYAVGVGMRPERVAID